MTLTTDKSGQDTQRLAPARAFSPVLNRNILALDLATRTGWAIATRDGRILSGCESFVPRASWDPGQRGLRFKAWLQEVVHHRDIHAIAYEVVIRHGPQNMAAAAHLYGLLEGLMWMAASLRQLPVEGVQPTVVKKVWTGSGRADKGAMVAEAKRRGFRPVDDNEADALAILNWALSQKTEGRVQLGDGTMPDPKNVKRISRKHATKAQGRLV
ncbi:hypothetical protein [Pigmentiphaga daeguensis]|uniref:Uncharacterized protein n=1 Tax=Pigmentiphaga daeguensis TaxID=414049 RepID=A0ABN1D6E4_9BURK